MSIRATLGWSKTDSPPDRKNDLTLAALCRSDHRRLVGTEPRQQEDRGAIAEIGR